MYTTTQAVADILGDDWDTNRPLSDLQQYIDTAYITLKRVVTCAARKGVTYDAQDLEMIERWMAAHCYCQSDKAYASRTTLDSSGQFQGRTDMGWASSNYGQHACRLDWSGCLFNVDKQQRASGRAVRDCGC